MQPIHSMSDYRALYQRSLEQPESFWAEEAECVSWFHPFRKVLEADPAEADFSWFVGGRLNVAHNCVDRHAEAQPDKIAIRWVGNEPGERRDISYRELERQVGRLANVLRRHGVARGDRVC